MSIVRSGSVVMVGVVLLAALGCGEGGGGGGGTADDQAAKDAAAASAALDAQVQAADPLQSKAKKKK